VGQLPRGWRDKILQRFKRTQMPVLMIYGTGDPTTEEALQWHRALLAQRENAMQPHVRLIDGANHSFYGLDWEAQVFSETDAWLGHSIEE
jgi:pimeloyl-ACP methyl ester carboxylesterase